MNEWKNGEVEWKNDKVEIMTRWNNRIAEE